MQKQVVDLMECTEAQEERPEETAESPEMEEQPEGEGNAPVRNQQALIEEAGLPGAQASVRDPRYKLMIPLGESEDPPRALTYTKKTLAATIVPINRGGHQDVMVVELAGQGLHFANVYNANLGDPESGITLKKAQQKVKDRKMILVGDLSLHSQLWDSKKEDSSDCDQIHDWVEQEGVTLLNEPDDNTCFSNKSSVIDLAFASDSLLDQSNCTTRVSKNLNCGSDHLPLATTIGNVKVDDIVRRMDAEAFKKACPREAIMLEGREPTREAEIESFAVDLTKMMTKALDRAAPRALGNGTGKGWWTQQCTKAVKEMRVAWGRTREDGCRDTSFEVDKAKGRLFQATICKAKRDQWRKMIEDLTEAKDVFRLVNCLKAPKSDNGLPPTVYQGRPIYSPQGKAEAVLDTHTQPAENGVQGMEEANPRTQH
ncbi:Endonuclease/Exonuclease/phosphatase family protein [Ceratocystis lukuohia]|uniref:Endonuclease/Exonuclease/phosphatase family protein n=1 Tax=Ceratocystis lukuohia TaxID=2019550 RepID=A0ABR4MGF0_9PEZI